MRDITNSEAGTLSSCEMEWWFSYRFNPETGRGDGCGISPKTPFMPFWMGDGFHQGLEYLYGTDWDSEAAIAIAMKAMEQPEDVWVDEAAFEKGEKSKAAVAGMIRGYAAARHKDLENWEVLFCEKGFNSIPLFEVDRETGDAHLVGEHTYAGKIDMRARRLTGKHAGEIWAWDHKSTAAFSDGDMEALKVADQPTRYFHALQHMGEPVEGMIWNMVRKPSIRQKKNETYDDFLDRLEADYSNPERKAFYFKREIVRFSKGRVAQSLAHLVAASRRITDLEAEKRDPMRNTRMCNMMGRCRYLDICASGEFKGAVARKYVAKSAIHEELVSKH